MAGTGGTVQNGSGREGQTRQEGEGSDQAASPTRVTCHSVTERHLTLTSRYNRRRQVVQAGDPAANGQQGYETN